MSGVAEGAATVPAGASESWRDRLRAAHDRLLASPGFRRWAAAFPLTRPVARRRAAALFDLSAGFVYSQILLACVQLDLFAALAEGPRTVPALARRSALPEPAMRRLLDAAAGLGLVARRSEGRFGLGALGAALVGNPAVTGMIAHHPMLYRDLRDPVALLRGETPESELARYWPYGNPAARARLEAGDATPYSSLMSASQALIAEEVLDAFRLRRHRCLLDVGGGEGGFVTAALRRTPRLRAILFDLPAVAARAQQHFAAQRLPAVAVGGDFLADPLPSGADVASLVRVLHDHDDDVALAILRAVRQALPAGGTLLLAEPMDQTPGAASVGAYFAFYLLAMGHGRPRSRREIEAMLRQAGFDRLRARATSTPMLTSVITARAAAL